MEQYRIESEQEVKTYIDHLKYALKHNATISFQEVRRVDAHRKMIYTNKYTMANLFPEEDPLNVLKRELQTLTVKNYLRTAKDLRFPKRSEMREFGKVYNGTDEVYIKIRVELLGENGAHTTFVMSFHFAEKAFKEEVFPYCA